MLAPGEVGQVEARGAMVMDGYHLAEEATREVLADDDWLKTGDLGLLRTDGRLAMAGGRLRDMIIRGGENIYPVEIEKRAGDPPGGGRERGVRRAGRLLRRDRRGRGAFVGVTDGGRDGRLPRRADRRLKVPAVVYGIDRFP